MSSEESKRTNKRMTDNIPSTTEGLVNSCVEVGPDPNPNASLKLIGKTTGFFPTSQLCNPNNNVSTIISLEAVKLPRL